MVYGWKTYERILASPGDLAIITLQFIQTFFMLLLFQFQQLGFQQFHRCILVLVLGSFVLARHHDIGRQVGDPDSRIRLIDMLTACPRWNGTYRSSDHPDRSPHPDPHRFPGSHPAMRTMCVFCRKNQMAKYAPDDEHPSHFSDIRKRFLLPPAESHS